MKNNNKLHTLILLFGCLTTLQVAAKTHFSPIPINTPTVNNTKETWITVFVHGIMSIQPHLTLSNIARFIRDDVSHTTYSKTVEYMRLDPYFYLNQAMQGFGLKKIDVNDLQPGNASSAIANIYDQVVKLTSPNTDNHYYTFGWSGLLSPSSRYKDSIQFLQELTAELKEKFWKHNVFPKIRFIGYSHGGNVCLNVAAAKNNTDPHSLVSVDELILVGVPIQTETDFLSADPIFKKIYHVFSRADRIQRIDFFSFNRVFSRRYFRSNHHFKVPKKLMQIEIKINRRRKSKHKMTKQVMEEAVNFNDPAVVSGRSHIFTNCSPGHLEFWFFGWSPKHYRSNFALRPLPTFVFIPYIIQCINSAQTEFRTPYPIIVDIRPEFNSMVIKQRKRRKHNEFFEFLSPEQVDTLKHTANQVAIDSSFEDEYDDHVEDAFEKARKYYKIYDHRKSRRGSSKRNRRLRKRNLTSHIAKTSYSTS